MMYLSIAEQAKLSPTQLRIYQEIQKSIYKAKAEANEIIFNLISNLTASEIEELASWIIEEPYGKKEKYHAFLSWASENADVKLINLLLSNQTIREAAHLGNNYALRKAVTNTKVDNVHALLEIPQVRNNIASCAEECITPAVTKIGAEPILDSFLAMPEVANNSKILEVALMMALRWSPNKVERIAQLPGLQGASMVLIALKAKNKDKVIELLDDPKALDDIKNNPLEALLLAVECEWTNADPVKRSIIIEKILAIDEVKKVAHANNNAAIVLAMKSNNEEAFNALLASPEVRATIAANNNAVLIEAIKKGNKTFIQALLALPEVRENVHANNNEVLLQATKGFNKDLIMELLSIPQVLESLSLNRELLVSLLERNYLNIFSLPKVQEQIPANDYELFRLACKYGDDELIGKLLAIPGVSDNAHLHDNEAIQFLAKNTRTMNSLKRVLSLPKVRENAHVNNNDLLIKALQNKNIDMANELLSIPSVRQHIQANAQIVLFEACRIGDLELVKNLLSIPEVRERAHENGNRALASANSYEIVELLLAIPAVYEAANNLESEAFANAVDRKDLKSMKLLLSFNKSKDAAHLNNNKALTLACESGDVELAQQLLSLPNVRELAHLEYKGFHGFNAPLRFACEKGLTSIALDLLTLPKVRMQAEIYANDALQKACKSGLAEVAKELLTIEGVRMTLYHNLYQLRQPERVQAIFADACESGMNDVVVDLLSITGIKDIAHENDNQALRVACEHNRMDVIHTLLSLKNVHQAFVANNGTQLFFAFEQFPDIRKGLINALSIYGLPLSIVFKDIPEDEWVKSLHDYLNTPVDFLKAKGYPEPVIEAVHILHTKQIMDDHKHFVAEQERNRQRFNNVDDEARIGSVRQHFNAIIKPHFQEAFDSYGDNIQTRVEGIEYAIRQMLLDEIVSEAQELGETDEKAKAIINFIQSLDEQTRKSLCKGDDEQLMKQAREIFTVTVSSPQTAWRAYDRWAPVGAEWPNLFTAPLKDQNTGVYTVGAVGMNAPTTQMASELVREMTAYSFLLATDQHDGDDSSRALRKMVLISKIAETRRAHNAGSLGVDDPSCLPGSISRQGDMWIEHSKSIIPDAPQLMVEELATLVLEQLNKAPKPDLENLYQALVMLSSYNALELISGQHEYSDESLRLRREFINSLGDKESLFKLLNERIQARGSRAITPEEFDIYVGAYVADIAGPWAINRILNFFQKDAAAAKQLENPFDVTLFEKLSLPRNLTTILLTRALRNEAIPNRNGLIQQSAGLLTEGKIQEAMDLLKSNLSIVAFESIEGELNKLLQEQTQKGKIVIEKAKLWEELYHQFKTVKIDDKEKVLMDIVNSVIDNHQDLNQVLMTYALTPRDNISNKRPEPLMMSPTLAKRANVPPNREEPEQTMGPTPDKKKKNKSQQ